MKDLAQAEAKKDYTVLKKRKRERETATNNQEIQPFEEPSQERNISVEQDEININNDENEAEVYDSPTFNF